MTFQTEGGEVPLGMGQFLFSNKTVQPKKKINQAKKISRNYFGSLYQRMTIGALVVVNVSLMGTSMVGATHTSQVQQVRDVQTAVAPTPIAESVKIQPVAAPKAIVAEVAVEKVEPTPTPKAAVAAASVSRLKSTPQVGNWDALLQQHFGGAWLQAKKVMLCESGGNARAVGPTDRDGFNPIGLFQIKNFAGRPSTAALMDAATNISWAAKMSGAGSSWKAWQCKP